MGLPAGPRLLPLLDHYLVGNEFPSFFAVGHSHPLAFLEFISAHGLSIPEHLRVVRPRKVAMHLDPSQAESLRTWIQGSNPSPTLMLAHLRGLGGACGFPRTTHSGLALLGLVRALSLGILCNGSRAQETCDPDPCYNFI